MKEQYDKEKADEFILTLISAFIKVNKPKIIHSLYLQKESVEKGTSDYCDAAVQSNQASFRINQKWLNSGSPHGPLFKINEKIDEVLKESDIEIIEEIKSDSFFKGWEPYQMGAQIRLKRKEDV